MNAVQWGFVILVALFVMGLPLYTLGWVRGRDTGVRHERMSQMHFEARNRQREMERPTNPIGPHQREQLERRNAVRWSQIMEQKGWLNEDGEAEDGWMYEVIHDGFGRTIDIVRSPEPDLGEI